MRRERLRKIAGIWIAIGALMLISLISLEFVGADGKTDQRPSETKTSRTLAERLEDSLERNPFALPLGGASSLQRRNFVGNMSDHGRAGGRSYSYFFDSPEGENDSDRRPDIP